MACRYILDRQSVFFTCEVCNSSKIKKIKYENIDGQIPFLEFLLLAISQVSHLPFEIWFKIFNSVTTQLMVLWIHK